jgi:hypothetical protein
MYQVNIAIASFQDTAVALTSKTEADPSKGFATFIHRQAVQGAILCFCPKYLRQTAFLLIRSAFFWDIMQRRMVIL